ncbi:MAG: hypothetical protein CL833_09270 [Crocinitomicaceae bacterium]|nr:hypothetical protein [Crocinitomicaceae bacterium]|tara:strand:- start:172 stop:630 length:459 start_codon:yes stop_codon:yes gene_type:complete
MTKYRRLTVEELDEMQQEFIHYLVANGIEAKDWEQLKEKDESQAQLWIDSFSDVVIQKVLEGVKYIEHRTSNESKLFECLPDEIRLIGLRSEEVDLLDSEELAAASLNPGKVELFKGVKKYSKKREDELFELLQSGGEISDGKMYLLLKQMV